MQSYVNREMMESLPNDLWIKTFLSLPVTTILQCLSVCKSWYLFIKHPTFINAHLHHQKHDLMFVRHIPDDNQSKKTECYSLHCDDENFTVYATYEFPLSGPSSRNQSYRVVGSCNGIICITDDQYHIGHETYLWNPTIQKCIELPPPMYNFGKNIRCFVQELGFGFDKKNNDYKVVRIVSLNYSDLIVEIYSLNSGLWREASHLASNLGVQIIERAFTGKDCQVYLKGFVYWIGMDLKQSCFIIIAFNLADELFHCFEPPRKYDRYNLGKSKLLVFQESLSFLHCDGQKCSIWTMKDYGDSTSWAKHVDVDFSRDVRRVIGLRRKGELLIEIRGGLYSYDYEAAKGKKFIVLDDQELQVLKIIQENNYPYFVSERIRDYDPESAPKDLGIRSNRNLLSFSFHSESYTESLLLIGRKNCCQVNSKTEKCERTHEGDNKRVGGIAAEVQNLGVEGFDIERS